MIGRANRVLVVLDDDHGVADVAQALERGDHLGVVLRVQADARLVEDIEHAHQPRPDLRGQADALRFTARERARPPIEIEVVEPDAEEQLDTVANFVQHLPSGVRAAAHWLDRAHERMQLVEVELSHVVDVLSADGEEKPRRPYPRAIAVGTGVLDHHLVEPLLHLRVRLASLPIAPVPAFDASGDAWKADLPSGPLAPRVLGARRRNQFDLLWLDAVENRLARALGQLLPGRVEREPDGLRQAEHLHAIPGLGVVAERFFDEAAVGDTPLDVGHEQIRVRQLVDAKTAARSAGALRIVEHEELGSDVAVDEVVRRAAER